MLLRFVIHLSTSVILLTNVDSCVSSPTLNASVALSWPDVNPSAFMNMKSSHHLHLQSPIDISTSKATRRKLPDLKFHNLVSEDVLVDMKNTGHTVKFTIDKDSAKSPWMSGGPLQAHGMYVFQDLHVHWGFRNILGGEHKVDNRSFSIEGHCVHFNGKYGTIEEAKKHEDGLAVVAFFLEAKGKDNPRIEEVVRLLPNITHAGTMARVRAGEVLGFFAQIGHPRNYYTYPGSLTTHPYTENVIWIVYPDSMLISPRQAEAFRSLLGPDMLQILHNSRDIKPFNDRPLVFAE